MDRNFRKNAAEGSSDSPPSAAWLFAQEILGKPIPDPTAKLRSARAEREHLEWLAQISTKHADQLRKLQGAEAEARQERELLVWAAGISTEAEAKLHALLREEAAAEQAQDRRERFNEAYPARINEWDEVDHPRRGYGLHPGAWVNKGDGGGSSGGTGPSNTSNEPNRAGGRDPNPHMLELAHAWWQTNRSLEQARRDINDLPGRIASERAQLGSGGRYAYIHTQNLAKAQRDLETAKTLVPQLEKQLGDLEQQYRDSGYDEVPYSTWTPGETLVGGKGIEQVGRAVAMGGSPAGLRPTGIEFDMALAAPAVLQLGRAVLKRSLSRALNKSLHDKPAGPPNSAEEVAPIRGGRYGHIEDPPSANSGKPFTPSQRKTIFAENESQNGGLLRDDRTGEILVPPQQRKLGVPAPPNEAQIDHVYPKSRGGPNTYSNAEVRSRLNNIRKGKKIE